MQLHYIQLQLGSSTQSGNFGAVALCTAMACLERSTSSRVLDNPLNLDLRGLGAVTKQNMHGNIGYSGAFKINLRYIRFRIHA